MKKLSALFGFTLIITGLAIVVFILIMGMNQFTLMNELPMEQQYVMGVLLAIMFIAFGFLMMND